MVGCLVRILDDTVSKNEFKLNLWLLLHNKAKPGRARPNERENNLNFWHVEVITWFGFAWGCFSKDGFLSIQWFWFFLPLDPLGSHPTKFLPIILCLFTSRQLILIWSWLWMKFSFVFCRYTFLQSCLINYVIAIADIIRGSKELMVWFDSYHGWEWLQRVPVWGLF